jgi:hypothetical protein
MPIQPQPGKASINVVIPHKDLSTSDPEPVRNSQMNIVEENDQISGHPQPANNVIKQNIFVPTNSIAQSLADV